MSGTEIERRANGAGHGGPARNHSWPPFAPGHELSTKHGAHSERRIAPVAARERRKVLRQMQTGSSDLSPIGRALVEHYARTVAKIVLLDDYLDEVGLLDEHGNPRNCLNLYVRLQNSALQALGRLESHMRTRDPDADLSAALVALRSGR